MKGPFNTICQLLHIKRNYEDLYYMKPPPTLCSLVLLISMLGKNSEKH